MLSSVNTTSERIFSGRHAFGYKMNSRALFKEKKSKAKKKTFLFPFHIYNTKF